MATRIDPKVGGVPWTNTVGLKLVSSADGVPAWVADSGGSGSSGSSGSDFDGGSPSTGTAGSNTDIDGGTP